jgi:hypothetical protein
VVGCVANTASLQTKKSARSLFDWTLKNPVQNPLVPILAVSIHGPDVLVIDVDFSCRFIDSSLDRFNKLTETGIPIPSAVFERVKFSNR